MFDKLIKYIVYILSFLIIAAFFAVIYGMYLKIYPKSSVKNNLGNIEKILSLSLNQDHKIQNIQVIDENRILVNVIYNGEMQGIIFDINTEKILQRIKK